MLNDEATKVISPYPGETEWHSGWKKAFPVSYREKTFLNKLEGYYHRADVFTPCGTAIEFQNSPICVAELQSREAFYPNLIWVVNGAKFKGFKILKHLPDVDDPKLAAFEFRDTANLCMVRKSDVLSGIVKPRVLTFHHPELRHIPLTSHYYSFTWRNPHRVWYEAKCMIVIDLGGYFLYQLKQRKQSSGDYAYLHMIPRKDFIERYVKK
ncbi:competence protein [Pedobacter polaris]|uniref:Competence protein n=1 Tax=Pedobacter polaris TaxID=2571273 RepID=A0A4U1CTM0_9SPHI|nr:competence protein [Pedobacter polaris]